MYEQAAQKGNPSGYYNLGQIYRQDKSGDQKKTSQLVMDYMQRAAYMGNDRAKDFVSKLSSNLPSAGRMVICCDQNLKGDDHLGAVGRDALDHNNVNVKYNSQFY